MKISATVHSAKGGIIAPGISFVTNSLGDTQIRWVGDMDKSEKVRGVSSCVEFFETRLFRDLGGFDDRFLFDYFEMDFCLRAEKEVGAVSCAVPLPDTVHLAGGPRPAGAQGFVARDAFVLRRKWRLNRAHSGGRE